MGGDFCLLSLAEGSALRASHFLLLRQKKVSKEKATPGSAPGCARSLALLGRPGGWLNSPSAQTTPAEGPRPACVAQRLSRGPQKRPGSTDGTLFWAFLVVDRNIQNKQQVLTPGRFSGPHVQRRATELAAEKGRGLSEPRSGEFRSPRRQRVAQGSRQRRPRNLGSPFSCASNSLWLLSFGEAKESTPASKAEPQAKTNTQA